MKKLQKKKVVFQDGKQVKNENQNKPKAVFDSVADELIIESDLMIKEAKKSKGVRSITVFEEVASKEKAKNEKKD